MVKFYLGFGDVQSSAEVLALLEQAATTESPQA
jgi:hypothetical protein